MASPLVSVLVPVYNSDKYIAAAIESILQQTYPNIEIIIVDDGSSDSSYEIAKSFSSSRVKVFHQENKGACAARNKAFDYSSGDYILYLDSDDILEKNKIQIQIDALKNDDNSDTIVSGRWAEFKDDLSKLKYNNLTIYKNYHSPIDILADMWCNNEMMSSAVWLVPRKIIKNAGEWDESLHMNQDGEFFCRVILLSKKIIFTNAINYYRKENPDSISYSRYKPEKVKSLLKSYLLYEHHLEKYKNEYKIKRGLANNYYSFIYIYYHLYYSWVRIAQKRVDELELNPVFDISGGSNFKKLSPWLGYYNVLKLRKFLFKLGLIKNQLDYNPAYSKDNSFDVFIKSKKSKTKIILSSEPWGKMLLSKMHFARELSREGNAVYFVNPPRELSGEDSAIKEKLSSEKNVTIIHLQEKKLRVFSREKFRPLYLKYEKEYIEYILELTGPVDEIWCFNPHFISDLELIDAHRRILFVYDLYKGKNLLVAASQADAIVSVAQNILDEFHEVDKPRLLLHHGLAPEFAAIAEKKVVENLCLKNRKIRIGYVGNLLRNSLDAEVFKNLIKTHQNIEFHFWGAVRMEDNNVVGIDAPHKTLQFVTFLKSQTNVCLRGIKPTGELAEEMQEMDAFLFMYSREKDINQASNSHKLMEYLSTGKPIIGTHVSRYAGTGLLAMDVPDSKDFLSFFDKQIKRLEELSTAEEQKKRIDFALSNTYKKQVERVREFIADGKINIEKN